jgi:polysaccharide export outer membrane protein
MKRKYISFSVLSLVLLLASCGSQRKVTYFYRLNSKDSASINKIFESAPDSKIVKGDILAITISTLDPEAALPFNLPFISYASPTSNQVYNTNTLQTYLVDTEGDITMPTIGAIHLEGLNKIQAVSSIKEKLNPYLKNAVVNLRFQNFKVNVIGEVARPGQYIIENERATVLDVLALAGDMTIYGKRNNLLVIRENNGKLQFERINMNDEELFESPYYFLQQNDVVYVEPNNTKTLGSQNVSLYLQSISTVAALASAVTTIILVTKQ